MLESKMEIPPGADDWLNTTQPISCLPPVNCCYHHDSMPMHASGDVVDGLPEASAAVSPGRLDRFFLQIRSGREVRWNPTTIVALLTLVLFWALRMYFTWGLWGNLSIDSGR